MIKGILIDFGGTIDSDGIHWFDAFREAYALVADVLNYAFQMADKYNLDIKEIMLEKIRKNAAKYPVEKAKGSAKKYNEL